MNTTHFFRQVPADQFTGSMAYLESQQSLFRRDQTSGMIEIRIGQGESVILVFARGNSTGIYDLTESACEPILFSELRARLNSSNTPITSLVLPDVAGRLIWLRLESQLQNRSLIRNAAGWEAWIQEHQASLQNGLVEIACDFFDGFVYFLDGEMIRSESIFSTERGFQSNLPFSQYKQELACEVSIYNALPDSHANRVFLLRRGVAEWVHLMLDRYREMVGRKLLQIMVNQSNLYIHPWQWALQLEGTSLWDQHFFPSLDAAAKAYQAVLMSISEQSSLMIGNGLCQRLVSETYDQLNRAEQESLESQRLIPAALT